MRIFIAGGTGVVGRELVPLLVSRGHRVVATARTAEKAAALEAAGAVPAEVDGLDRAGVLRAVVAARPDVVVHQMTALATVTRFKNLGATDLAGVVLRYGAFYGPGTSLAPGGYFVEAVRKRRLPIIGCGRGVWSFSHIADVAEATRLAIEGGPPGLYNIVDDDPAEVSVWLPELARVIGARPPYRIPVWLGRLAAGEVGVRMMTQQRGASNAKAKRLLGWQPTYSSWRDGFRHGLGAAHGSRRQK